MFAFIRLKIIDECLSGAFLFLLGIYEYNVKKIFRYTPSATPKVATRKGMLTATKDITKLAVDNNDPANKHFCSPNLDTKEPDRIP